MINHGEIAGAVIRDLQNFKNAAYALIFTFLVPLIVINWSTIKPNLILPSDNSDLLVYCGRMITLLAVIVHILRWISNSTSQLNLCISHVNIGTPRPELFFAMFSLAVSLSLLAFAAAVSLAVFAGYMCVYLLISLWVWAVFRNQYRHCRRRTKSIDEQHSAILRALDGFWIHKPQMRRLGAVWVVSVMSFLLIIWSSALEPPWRGGIKVAAATLLLGSFLIAEVVLIRWLCAQHDAIDRVVSPSAVKQAKRALDNRSSFGSRAGTSAEPTQ
jgi:hypothetical protein